MTIRIKPIKNEKDYKEALDFLNSLISLDPSPDSKESDQLRILALLIEHYEKETFRFDIPNAIDAIKFRMEQLDLTPADLEPYLGSTSRVSEILAGKRSLTVDMINSLAAGLNIPEKVLLRQNMEENEYSVNIPTPVFRQMVARGYFTDGGCSSNRPQTLKKFFEQHTLEPATFFRKSEFRIDKNSNRYILVAWADRVLDKSNAIHANVCYKDGTITLEYMKQIAKYSVDENDGPRKAIAKLLEDGVKVVIEPALKGAKVDGVTILENKENPVIGLSLRYDRLDNFWFTLMHELAHISKHYNLDATFIYDDLEAGAGKSSPIEAEADSLASESLVEESKWLVSAAKILPSPLTAQALANELGVHMAIVAGKARYESGNWKYLAKTINQYKIRDKFKEVQW